MADAFSGLVDGVSAPATRGVAVSPHDTNPLADIPKALFIGGAGDLVVRGVNDSADVTFKNLAAGSVLPFRAKFVRAAAGIVAEVTCLGFTACEAAYRHCEPWRRCDAGRRAVSQPGAKGLRPGR